jgi:hypothetical protein
VRSWRSMGPNGANICLGTRSPLRIPASRFSRRGSPKKNCAPRAQPRAPAEIHLTRHRLHRFLTWCIYSDIPELLTLATTVDTSWPQINAFVTTGITRFSTWGSASLAGRATVYPGNGQQLPQRPTSAVSRCQQTEMLLMQPEPQLAVGVAPLILMGANPPSAANALRSIRCRSAQDTSSHARS